MITIWILWSVLTLATPKADAVLPVDEFTNSIDCVSMMKSLGAELLSMKSENIINITLTCIPVGARN